MESRPGVVLSGMKVLCVDDDVASARSLRRVLLRAGLTVDVAMNGFDALAMLDEHGYDAVITDLSMPGMSGLEFILRATERGATQPFLVVTGMEAVDLREAPQKSIVSVLRKPFEVDHLLDVVGRLLTVAEARRHAGTKNAGPSERVLIIEDDLVFAARLRALVDHEPRCTKVSLSESLEAAIEHIAHEAPTLIFADLQLRDACGLEVVRRLRAAAPTVPIVVLSEYEDEVMAGEAIELGVQDHMVKGELNTTLLHRAMVRARRRKRAEDRLTHLAYNDELTGLANARFLRSRLDTTIARVRRAKGNATLMYVDLDGFKAVNDTLGHTAGDQLLQAVARRITDVVRSYDTPARLGGDEFAVLLEDAGDLVVLQEIATRLLARLAEPVLIDGREVRVTGSVGIAVFPHNGTTSSQLMRAADKAMYEAKAAGKSGFRFASLPSGRPIAPAFNIIDALRKAHAENEFAVAFQPQLTLSDRSVVCHEALLRWRRSAREQISPDKFVPLLEEHGLIHSVGRWVMEAACRQAKAWHRERPVRVAVNVSPLQLEEPTFADEVIALLEAEHFAPPSLELEITERLLMRDTKAVQHNVHALREAGVRLALDDFGSGFASLSYLHRFRVDCIKIDRRYISQIDLDENMARLVGAIIGLAHDLGLEVVAEGVERRAQFAILRRQGCDLCQGYLTGRPSYADFARPRTATRRRSQAPLAREVDCA